MLDSTLQMHLPHTYSRSTWCLMELVLQLAEEEVILIISQIDFVKDIP